MTAGCPDKVATLNIKLVVHKEAGRRCEEGVFKKAGARMCILRRFSLRIHGGISEFFRREGIFVAQRPWTVIMVSLLVALVSVLPLLDWKFPGKGPIPFNQELDKDVLYSPSSSPSLGDRAYVEREWGDGVLLTSVFLVSRDPEEPNILSKPHLIELMDLWETVNGIEVEYDGKSYSWEDICARSRSLSSDYVYPCQVFSPLDAWGLNRTSLENDPDVLSTLTRKTADPSVDGAAVAAVYTGATTAFGSPLFRPLILGDNGVEVNDEGKLAKTEVFRISFFKQTHKVEIRGKYHDPVVNLWELALVDEVVHKFNGGALKGYVGSYSQVDRLSEEYAAKESRWVILSFALVLFISHIVLFRNSRAFCKTHLAAISGVAIVLAIGSAYGCVNLCGIPYNTVVQTVPFLLVGLGMDDTFVIMGAYSMVPRSLPIEERIAKTMQQAGSSILFTSITDFAAFSVGAFAQIPALQAFCLYAGVGVLFDFLFQVTFFVAFVALDARREVRSRSKKNTDSGENEASQAQKNDEVTTITTVIVPTPRVDIHIPSAEIRKSEASAAEERRGSDGESYPKLFGKGNYDPDAPTIGRRIFGELLPKFTLSPLGKVLVLVVELALLALAIYGCTKVYMDFRYLEWFTPKDSWLHESIAVEEKYFDGEKLGFSIYTKEAADGADYFYHQDELAELSSVLASSPYISEGPIPVSSWYDSFILWSRASKIGQVDLDGRAPNAALFNEWIKEFLEDKGEVFLDAIKFSDDGSHIVGSRFLAFSQPVGAMTDLLDNMSGLRESATSAAPSLDVITYGNAFPFLDSFRTITSETIQNVLGAAAAVFVICLLVLADFLTTVWVVLMVALTDVFLFGFMHYANLQFNIVTSINIILAVGIAVDYSSHVAHAYLSASGSRQERAERALYCIGCEVFSGGLTTWVAVVGLGFAGHYIFNVFFKMFFVVVVAGVWHGIFVLPVILSVMGSQHSWSTDIKNEHPVLPT